MSAPATHQHATKISQMHAEARKKRRYDLSGMAAPFAKSNDLEQLNVTTLSRTSGIDRLGEEGHIENSSDALPLPAQLTRNEPSASRNEVLPSGELTLDEILRDPLIAMVNRADCVTWRSYAQLMQSAARVFAGRVQRKQIERCGVESSSFS